MKLQRDFIVVSGNNRFELHRLIVMDNNIYDMMDNKILVEDLINRKKCRVILQTRYDDIIQKLTAIIYGKFADPETPIEDLVNCFKYIHNIFLNEPCED